MLVGSHGFAYRNRYAALFAAIARDSQIEGKDKAVIGLICCPDTRLRVCLGVFIWPYPHELCYPGETDGLPYILRPPLEPRPTAEACRLHR